MKDIINKNKLFILIITVFTISSLLLSFSYSKESGMINEVILIEDNASDLRVVYSSANNINTSNNNEIDLSITNKSNQEKKYTIELIGTTNISSLYYSIDSGDLKPVTEEALYIGTLSPYGKTNDQITHNIKFYSDDSEVSFKVKVKESIEGE